MFVCLFYLNDYVSQYEEARLLETSRGSNKLYAKTRLELAWDKERQDQQKVLHDAQRILRDLKERLLRAEHEREQQREMLNKQMQKQMSELSEDQITKELLDVRDLHHSSLLAPRQNFLEVFVEASQRFAIWRSAALSLSLI